MQAELLDSSHEQTTTGHGSDLIGAKVNGNDMTTRKSMGALNVAMANLGESRQKMQYVSDWQIYRKEKATPDFRHLI